MGANYGLEEAVFGKGVFLETGKMLVAFMLDTGRQQEERHSDCGLKGWPRDFQETG
jgi:hypothetical protein